MSEVTLKEVDNLLRQILVFEIKFKEEILAKAKSLDEAGLAELKKILWEVNRWQEKVLETKIKEDAGFYDKLAAARAAADQKVMSLYKQKLDDEDRKKMDIILSKINLI